MGLLAWLFGSDPTDKWPTQNVATPDYDLDHHRLCGIRLGNKVDAFSRLGRAEDRPRARKGTLVYFSRGLELSIEEGHAMDLHLHFDRDWAPADANPQPFPGRLTINGRDVRWTNRTTETEITVAMGDPDKRDADEDEILLTYTRSNFTYDIELSAEGRLRGVIVTAEEKIA